MTVVVGILCDDGVVVGSDSSATFTAGELRTIEQPTKKVFVIRDEIIFAGAGAVGCIQRFENVLRHLASTTGFLKKDRFDITKQISQNVIGDLAATQCPRGNFGAVVAFRCADGFQLCEFGTQDLQPEFKTADTWFVTMGSGQPITDPFLGMIRKAFFGGDRPKRAEGIFAVAWTLQQAIELNPGGINGPPQIAVLAVDPKTTRYVARLLAPEELEEHTNNIKGIEECLAKYRAVLAGAESQSIPEPDVVASN